MNKSFIKKNNKTFVVSTEKENKFIFNSNNNVSNDTVNEILSIENELEELNNNNWSLYSSKNNIDKKENISKLVYLLGIPSIILSYSGISFLSSVSLNETIIGALIMSSIIVPLNIGINGTYLSRKRKINKIDLQISNNNKIIDKLTNKINSLKEQVKFGKKQYQSIHIIKPIDRTHENYEVKELSKKLTKD